MDGHFRLLGIRFRSRAHKDWLIVSIVLLVAGPSWFLIDRYLNEHTATDRPFSFFFVGMALHSLITVCAFGETYCIGRRESGDLSVDCVWFNILAAISHLGLLCFVVWLSK